MISLVSLLHCIFITSRRFYHIPPVEVRRILTFCKSGTAAVPPSCRLPRPPGTLIS